MSPQQFFSVKLLNKAIIARDILELRFERPRGFVFSAGQFVQFNIPDGEKFVLRSYSISSSPEAEYLEFCVKILPDGKASRLFNAIQPGEFASISNATGRFVCALEHSMNKKFIATGAGLAPIMSMIEYEVEKSRVPVAVVSGGDVETLHATSLRHDGKIELLFGVRSEEDVFWLDRLNNLRQKDYNFAFTVTLSRPSELWPGVKGRVSEHVTINSEPTDYYICGSLEMVKDVRKILIDGGVDTKSVHFEVF